MNILFVCTGNISRSFLAEMLMKYEVRQHGLKDIHVSSAGVAPYPGTPADPEMAEYLSEIGVEVEAHEARRITQENVDWADLVLVMEKKQFEAIQEHFPGAGDKMELLGQYISAGPIVDDIIDPFGRSSYHYRLSQAQITQAIGSLIKRYLPASKK